MALYPSKRLYPSLTLFPGAPPSRPPNPVRRIPTPTAPPKLKVPIRMGTTGLATVEQDSREEVAACCYALVATERGSRLEQTGYGCEGLEFDQLPLDEGLDEVLTQIGRWEPRAKVRTRQEIEDLIGILKIEVGVSG